MRRTQCLCNKSAELLTQSMWNTEELLTQSMWNTEELLTQSMWNTVSLAVQISARVGGKRNLRWLSSLSPFPV